MDTDIAPTHEASQPSRCSGVKRDGTQCKAWAITGETTCRVHSMSAEELAAHQASITARSAAARADVLATRRDLEESARKGLNALMGERLEAEADVFVERLRDLALSPDPGVALQGMKLWLERVYGRAVQPSVELADDSNPVVAAFTALSPEERRTLLRLAQPLPDVPDTASQQG
jgi:hypothetical protein